jgi:hypothetical protein
MVERRERVKERVGFVLVAVRLGHVIYDRFGVFNHVTVAVDDGVTLVRHGYILPVDRSPLSHQGKDGLSRLTCRFASRDPAFSDCGYWMVAVTVNSVSLPLERPP